MVEFFKDILKERYEPVKTVYKIEALVPKSTVGKFKKCAISVKCKSRTNTQCDNSVCQKFACREHSAIVCESCANSAEFGKITVSKKPLYAYANKKAPRRCEISKCPKKARFYAVRLSAKNLSVSLISEKFVMIVKALCLLEISMFSPLKVQKFTERAYKFILHPSVCLYFSS